MPEILSLGRNNIKKLKAWTAWISYNNIEKPAGIEKLESLEVLFMSNNNVGDWKEFDRLKELPSLKDLLLVNTPLYNAHAWQRRAGGCGHGGVRVFTWGRVHS